MEVEGEATGIHARMSSLTFCREGCGNNMHAMCESKASRFFETLVLEHCTAQSTVPRKYNLSERCIVAHMTVHFTFLLWRLVRSGARFSLRSIATSIIKIWQPG